MYLSTYLSIKKCEIPRADRPEEEADNSIIIILRVY